MNVQALIFTLIFVIGLLLLIIATQERYFGSF